MACDLFGNPLNGKTVSLTEEPVYLFGSELKKKLETVDFRMKTPYRVLGAAESMRNGAKHIAVEFRNMSPEPRAMQARIAGLPGTRSFTVAADSAKTVYFPLNGKDLKFHCSAPGTGFLRLSRFMVRISLRNSSRF